MVLLSIVVYCAAKLYIGYALFQITKPYRIYTIRENENSIITDSEPFFSHPP